MRVAGRLLLAAIGVSDVSAGLALLAQPAWFYEHIGHFAPYNQHYEGDAGAFILAVGVGLLMAALRPAVGRVPFAVGLLASAVHLANHVYASALDASTWGSTMNVGLQVVGLAIGGALVYGRASSKGAVSLG